MNNHMPQIERDEIIDNVLQIERDISYIRQHLPDKHSARVFLAYAMADINRALEVLKEEEENK